MIPVTYPSSVSTSKESQMVVFALPSVTGLRRWTDYIPVKLQATGADIANSFNTNGYLACDFLQSTTGRQAWIDYIPVFVDNAATTAWQVSDTGFIPFNTLAGGGLYYLGPSLDLNFIGSFSNPLFATTAEDYTLNTNFLSLFYQVEAQYSVQGPTGIEQKNFADIVTFTRTGSTATFFNSAGVLTTAAADVPRFDYDPSTLALRGLLIEEARTNSIRNNTMQGAVAGTPGTLPTNWARFTSGTAATSVVGTGTESGIAYVDVAFSGGNTDGISFFVDGTTGHAALNGQIWTGSSYYRLMAGSFANCTINHVVYEANSSGTALASSPTSLATVTSAGLSTQRVIATRTNNNASTAEEQLAVVISGTGAFSFTLRIGLPQLEQGAFATSVIATTTIPLTRNADVANINTLSPWYNQVEGTVYAEFMNMVAGSATQTNSSQGVWSTTQSALGSFNGYGVSTNLNLSNTATIVFRARYVPTSKNDSVTVGAASGFLAANTVYKTAAAWDASQITADTSVGALNTTTNNAAADMGTHNQMQLGAQNTGGAAPFQLNGWLRRISYYPRRLSDADLATITT